MSGTSTGLEKKNKPRKKRKAVFRTLLFLVIVVLTAASSIFSYKYVLDQNKNKEKIQIPEIAQSERIEFEIPKGASTTVIAKSLEEKGVIKYPFVFKLMSKINGFDGTYRSGTHYISKKLNYDQIMAVLSGEPVSAKVLVQEGLTVKETVDVLADKKLIDKDQFIKAMNNEKFDFKFLEGVPKREYKLEGYLFPDTYQFDLKTGEKGIIQRMLENFDKKFKPEYYNKAKALKLSVDQVIILASIIEREAQESDERRVISGVFHNRLNSKDKTLRKLQSCATLQYIFLKKDGKVKEKLLDSDTKIQDPYNTYLNEGLPPGPICSPGQASIEAALNPEKTDYLYFAAKGDGSHQFSKTYKDHQAAIKKYGLN
ncbi:MAG: endolytic transglycosylase MltG [Clostridia bacterium]|nr:endolytic transglycosylase MltG [Clostridia bacterium]